MECSWPPKGLLPVGIMQRLLLQSPTPPLTPPPTPPSSPPTIERPCLASTSAAATTPPLRAPQATSGASAATQVQVAALADRFSGQSIDERFTYCGVVDWDGLYGTVESVFKEEDLQLQRDDLDIGKIIAFMQPKSDMLIALISSRTDQMTDESADLFLSSGYGVWQRRPSGQSRYRQQFGNIYRSDPKETLMARLRDRLHAIAAYPGYGRRYSFTILLGDCDSQSKVYTDLVRQALRKGIDFRIYLSRFRDDSDWDILEQEFFQGNFPNSSFVLVDVAHTIDRFLTSSASSKLETVQRWKVYVSSLVQAGFNDHSNFWYGLKRIYSSPWTELRLEEVDWPRVAEYMVSLCPEYLLLATNEDYWLSSLDDAFRSAGAKIETRPLQRQPDGSKKEVGVDDILTKGMADWLEEQKSAKMRVRMVLFTGDGQETDERKDGFPGRVREALKYGGDLTIGCFEKSMSGQYRRIRNECLALRYPKSTYTLIDFTPIAHTFVTQAGKDRFEAGKRLKCRV